MLEEQIRECFLPTEHMVSKVCEEIFRSVLCSCLLFYVYFSNVHFVSFSNVNCVLIFMMLSNENRVVYDPYLYRFLSWRAKSLVNTNRGMMNVCVWNDPFFSVIPCIFHTISPLFERMSTVLNQFTPCLQPVLCREQSKQKKRVKRSVYLISF